MCSLPHLWPKESREVDQEEKDEEDISDGLVFHLDTSEWRLTSPDEVDEWAAKFEVGDEMNVRFKRREERYDAEEVSIYRVSVNQREEGSVMKRIDAFRRENDFIEEHKGMRFEDEHEIVFIRTDVTIFDNTQVDKNQMFIVSTPYTIFLWIGNGVKMEMLKGAISIF